MKQPIVQSLDVLKQFGWCITFKAEKSLTLCEDVMSRYPQLPEEYVDFLRHVVRCVNADETAWFLCENDFNGDSDSAFAWNEAEIQSLEAAEGDEDLTRTIRHFWSRHMPIAFSVKTGYAYLGLELASESFGAVVCGREPEYEDAEHVSASFSELVATIGSAAGGRVAVSQLDDFI